MLGGLLPQEPVDQAFAGAAGLKAIQHGGLKGLLGYPFFMALSASPTGAWRNRASIKAHLLGHGPRPDYARGGGPADFAPLSRGPASSYMSGFNPEAFMQEKIQKYSSEKIASLGRIVSKIKNYIYPEVRSAISLAPGARTLRPWLKAPLRAAGIMGATYGVASGYNYIAGQADLISRAKAYKRMMGKYGPDILEEAQNQAVDVPESKIRDFFNSAFTVSPVLTRDPTIAAAQVTALIRDAAAGAEYGGRAPNLIPHGIAPYAESAKAQGEVGRYRPALTPIEATKAMGGLLRDTIDPFELAQNELRLAEGEPVWRRSRPINAARARLTEIEHNMAQLLSMPHTPSQFNSLRGDLERARDRLSSHLTRSAE